MVVDMVQKLVQVGGYFDGILMCFNVSGDYVGELKKVFFDFYDKLVMFEIKVIVDVKEKLICVVEIVECVDQVKMLVGKGGEKIVVVGYDGKEQECCGFFVLLQIKILVEVCVCQV